MKKNQKNLFLKKRPIRTKKNAFHITVSVGLVRTRTVISKKLVESTSYDVIRVFSYAYIGVDDDS